MSEVADATYRAGSGQPLVLLHGFTGTWRHWQPLLEALAKRMEVIAPTLAGHAGGPPYPSGCDITFAAGADSLESHLDELGVDSAHFVGNSMGGALALEMAKRGRARSVVALAPAGGWNSGDGEALRLARFFSRQQRLTRALAPRLPRIMRRARTRRFAFRDIMRRGDRLSPAQALDLARSSIECEIAERAITALRQDRDLVLRDLDRIACPVLMASPQFDRVLPPARHAPRLRREIPGVEARTLPGCGHVPMWDDPASLVAMICRFALSATQAQPSAQARIDALAAT